MAIKLLIDKLGLDELTSLYSESITENQGSLNNDDNNKKIEFKDVYKNNRPWLYYDSNLKCMFC